jgi:hypothetical protein
MGLTRVSLLPAHPCLVRVSERCDASPGRAEIGSNLNCILVKSTPAFPQIDRAFADSARDSAIKLTYDKPTDRQGNHTLLIIIIIIIRVLLTDVNETLCIFSSRLMASNVVSL